MIVKIEEEKKEIEYVMIKKTRRHDSSSSILSQLYATYKSIFELYSAVSIDNA